MRRAAKVDDNQSEIVKHFRMLGYSVATTHQLGKGFPDLVVGKHGINYLIEVKDGSKEPARRKLTTDEKTFFEEWRGQRDIIETVDDVYAFDRAHVAKLEPQKNPATQGEVFFYRNREKA